MNAHKEIDTRGMNCPLPILKAKKALSGMESGQLLTASFMDYALPRAADIPPITASVPDAKPYLPMGESFGIMVPKDTPANVVQAIVVARVFELHPADQPDAFGFEPRLVAVARVLPAVVVREP